ncbi:MAG: LCP family protein, partial [Robinsoniella sp.]|nr:LCP family protein [Robinsoniella sp.]
KIRQIDTKNIETVIETKASTRTESQSFRQTEESGNSSTQSTGSNDSDSTSNTDSTNNDTSPDNDKSVNETNSGSDSNENSGNSSKSDTDKNSSNDSESIKISENSSTSSQGTSVKEEKVYTILISGIDNRGGIVAKSRSDVNIIATVNTATRQILLVSTPRDYFVPLSISNGVPDKLTHAGIYGISVCMDTLGMLYDIDINNYIRLNFDGFIKIIDALGGITVNSEYDFDTDAHHFDKGENVVDGEAALAFARERYAFASGDRQRGKNQMAVIKGVIDKILSPELLKNYSSILSSVEGCFETNLSYDEIASLCQQQLSEGGSWNVVSYSVDGTGDSQQPYSMNQYAYVMVPDDTTVDHAKELMAKVRGGEKITQE